MLASHDPAAEPETERADEDDDALGRLYAGGDLTRREAERLFAALVRGEQGQAGMAAMLVALRLKGETTDELIGAALALRAAALTFPRPDYLFADSCGTGGDGSGSINVSTAVAFVAAAAGLPIVKHGNRSFSSCCGSADVLERLGARLDLTAEASRRALDQTGLCFLFAPQYHPGLRHAGPVRQALKVRTIMNLLGPCLNPAAPPVQLLGVPDPRLVVPIARTLAALGVETALVVHGAPLDEIALHGETVGVRFHYGKIDPVHFTPEDAGLVRAPLEAIRGGDPSENAHRLRRLLAGQGRTAECDLVALNAGALLMTASIAGSLREGTATASEVLLSGAAGRVLDAYIEASRG